MSPHASYLHVLQYCAAFPIPLPSSAQYWRTVHYVQHTLLHPSTSSSSRAEAWRDGLRNDPKLANYPIRNSCRPICLGPGRFVASCSKSHRYHVAYLREIRRAQRCVSPLQYYYYWSHNYILHSRDQRAQFSSTHSSRVHPRFPSSKTHPSECATSSPAAELRPLLSMTNTGQPSNRKADSKVPLIDSPLRYGCATAPSNST